MLLELFKFSVFSFMTAFYHCFSLTTFLSHLENCVFSSQLITINLIALQALIILFFIKSTH